MEVVAFDKFVAAERFRELGVERAGDDRRALRHGRHHHDPPAEDAGHGQLDRRRGDRADEGRRPDRQLRPRRAGRPRRARGRPRVGQGRRRRARRVPRRSRSPSTRCSAATTSSSPRTWARRPRRRRTAPGRSPPSRSGAALSGGRGHQRGQHRRGPARGDGGAGALRAALREARPARPGPRQRLRRSDHRRVPRPDRRARHPPARHRGPRRDPLRPHRGAGQPRQRAGAGRGARHRADRAQGRRSPTSSRSWSPCGSSRATTRSRSSGTAVGPRNLPHLVRVWGESFYMPFADHLVVFRYKDQPGMIGRVGTIFGEHGVNIGSAAVGAEASGDEAVLALTTDAPVPDELPRGDPEARGLPRRPRGRPLAGLSANEDAGVGSGRCARWSSPGTARPRCSRSRSARTRRCGPARCGSRSRPRASTSPTRWRASGSIPTRPSSRASSATRSRARSSRWGTGSRRHKVGDRVIAGTRFNGQAELVTVPAEPGAPAAEEAVVRGGRGVPGQLRDRLRGAGDHGRA